ncbi:MAG: hypothetical protein NTW03_13340 [Verrucomicrobia bacterium]|nr:hypothetical protein [Verrucomicrobiota bacterium]
MNTLRTPPCLLGAALLFWGWQSGLLLVGALLAVLIEAARWVGLRWDLAEKDFRRIWDFCVFLLLAVALYLFATGEGPSAVAGLLADASPATQGRLLSQTGQAMLVLFRWTPVIFFLTVAGQAYSTLELIPYSAFSLVLRRRSKRQGLPAPPLSHGVNTAYPYLAICLFASSFPSKPCPFFFVGCALLLAWALWSFRSRRYAAPVWLALFSLALVAGFVAQRGFYELNNWANLRSATWLAQFLGGSTDPKESRTSLGRIGRIQLSGKIVLRVEAKDGLASPLLLREASYRFFKFPDWASLEKAHDFERAQVETNQTTWELAAGQKAQHAVTISQYLTGRGADARRGLLALPHGIVRLENLPAFVVSTNRLGVVRVDEGPGLVIYDAHYRPGSTLDAPPEREDLVVPAAEEEVLSQIADQLALAGQSNDQILRKVEAFFLNNFQYSTWLPAPHHRRSNLTVLGNFLLHDKAGHCEYFATAATLLLRKAHLPSRYAVGYVVEEKSGNKYIVRQRHAHAWCLVWLNGAWHDFDVTPPSWCAAEAARASRLEWLSDAGSRLWFEFSKWRWGQADWRPYILWGLLPVLLVLLVRLAWGKRWRRFRQGQASPNPAFSRPGLDSESYQLEREVSLHRLMREPGETPCEWLEKLQDHPSLASLGASLRPLLLLHYRYRFDPAGLDRAAREELGARARQCLATLRRPVKP